jgi:hypothetical protein
MKVLYSDDNDIVDKVRTCGIRSLHEHIKIHVLQKGGFVAQILTHGGSGDPTIRTVHCPNRLCLDSLTKEEQDVPQVQAAIRALPLPIMRELPENDILIAYNYLWDSGLQEYSRAKAVMLKNENSATIAAFAIAAENKNSTTKIVAFFDVDDGEIEVHPNNTVNPPCSGICYYFFGENRRQYLDNCKAVEYGSEEFNPVADLNDLVCGKYPNAKKIGVTSVPCRSFDWQANLAYVLRTEGSLCSSQRSVTTSGSFSFTIKSYSFGVDYGETDKILESALSGVPWDGATYGCARGYMERYLINPILKDSIPLAKNKAKRELLKESKK